jgi:hypothetical protein
MFTTTVLFAVFLFPECGNSGKRRGNRNDQLMDSQKAGSQCLLAALLHYTVEDAPWFDDRKPHPLFAWQPQKDLL